MPSDHLIDVATERIFFFTLSNAAYEARVVPVKHGVRLALQTEYKVIDKAKQASCPACGVRLMGRKRYG
jgi:hypothetical protein